MLCVGGDLGHRARRVPILEIEDNGLVLESGHRDLGGYGEDEVEVSDRQEVGFSGGKTGTCGRPLAAEAMPIAPVVHRSLKGYLLIIRLKERYNREL